MPFTKDCFSYLVCLCVLVRFCLQFVWTQNFFGDKTKEYQTASAYPIKNLCLQTQLYRNYEVKNYLPFLPNTQLLHDCGQDQTKELRQDTRRCSCSRWLLSWARRTQFTWKTSALTRCRINCLLVMCLSLLIGWTLLSSSCCIQAKQTARATALGGLRSIYFLKNQWQTGNLKLLKQLRHRPSVWLLPGSPDLQLSIRKRQDVYFSLYQEAKL